MADPTLIIDGNRFDDIAGFYAEINRVFMATEDWQLGCSLDALDDMLYGGYGAMNGVSDAVITWVNIDKSRADLGLAATRGWLLAKLDQPDGFNRKAITAQLAALETGQGQTYFDIVAEIFADHPNLRLIHA